MRKSNSVYMVFAILLAIIVSLCVLTSCGNENWGPGSFTFTHAHIADGTEAYCATVSSWHDSEIGIELHTKEFGDLYCSEGTYLLFETSEKCPFCD